MERQYFKSVVSLVEYAHGRRSRALSPSPPIRVRSLAPVYRPSLTDFSINRILGLEDDVTKQESTHSALVSPPHSYSDTSPRSSPYSDNASSTSDCDSEPDQAPTHSEQSPRKKRQRTTFSPIEVWELERAYKRRPYLMSEDEEELVQRLGITVRSLKYWFQNRRARSRKEERMVTSVYQTSPSNQFGRPVSTAMHSERPQFLIQSPSDHWQQAERMSHQHSPPITADYRRSSFTSNQFRVRSSSLVPMFHPDQFKRRHAEPASLPYSRGLRKYQPY
ncbi:Bud site selection protein, Revert to axial protein 2 [Desmophyllum pertusum]|uniref:Bud site selection protein, Revert to axial protein 2 n=1 Tax=Desmophyllum pertusum TaxID=174260 RepID=A0A9X0CKD5_9CNID|nr:Bud site selection protein, Revert to axial protein 2 [Desmophyllum pertusum]